MALQQWFDGIYLLGQFNWFRTGCWLLVHQGEAAILEMPPTYFFEPTPAQIAQDVISKLAIQSVKYLLCTHNHWDHFSRKTYRSLCAAFPEAQTHLHIGFQKGLRNEKDIRYFRDVQQLDLSGEPLYLVHAPKHSHSDTMVIFRGVICTGDWELGTIRSVHDWTRFWVVSEQQKLNSIKKMEKFQSDFNYGIHRVFSVHANDKREDVNFLELMVNTRRDLPL